MRFSLASVLAVLQTSSLVYAAATPQVEKRATPTACISECQSVHSELDKLAKIGEVQRACLPNSAYRTLAAGCNSCAKEFGGDASDYYFADVSKVCP